MLWTIGTRPDCRKSPWGNGLLPEGLGRTAQQHGDVSLLEPGELFHQSRSFWIHPQIFQRCCGQPLHIVVFYSAYRQCPPLLALPATSHMMGYTTVIQSPNWRDASWPPGAGNFGNSKFLTMFQSTMNLAAQVLPDFPKDNRTGSQTVGWVAFHLVEGLVDLHLPEPTPNLQLEHTADHPRSVAHPCHLRLSGTTGSHLQVPAASASLAQKPPLPPASPVFGFLLLPTQLGPPFLGFLSFGHLPREPGSPQDPQISQDPGSPM